jgi:hypothetical protein
MGLDGLHGDFFGWCLQQAGVAPHKLAARRPDFLVISPPKTGSTWLADNLRHHLGVFVPHVKEVKYFSCYDRGFDLGWYLDHFAHGEGRVKGEATPTYALLPRWQIDLIRRLFRGVKLVFLMREPISRAWSHARHTLRYREANFFSFRGPDEEVTPQQWADNLLHDWTLAHGDYLGQLRRWLSVFPPEQLYVGFYESLAREPEALVRSVLRFLGADASLEMSAFPLFERILPGKPAPMPEQTARFAHRLFHGRSCELVEFLRERFGLAPPPEWEAVLRPPPVPDAGEPALPETPAAFLREWDDDYLRGVLAHEENFPTTQRVADLDYRGYEIVFQKGEFHALPLPGPEGRPEEAGRFSGLTLAEVKAQVDRHLFQEEATRRTASLEREARLERRVEEALGSLARLEAEVTRLAQLEAELARLGPGYSPTLRRLRLAWHGLKSFFLSRH